jgi:hypothetical protein
LCTPLEDGQQGPKHAAVKYKINTFKIVAKDGSSNNLDMICYIYISKNKKGPCIIRRNEIYVSLEYTQYFHAHQ